MSSAEQNARQFAPASLRQALLSKAEKRHRRAALQLEKWQKKVRQTELEHRRAVQGSLWEEDADVALRQNPGPLGTLFPD